MEDVALEQQGLEEVEREKIEGGGEQTGIESAGRASGVEGLGETLLIEKLKDRITHSINASLRSVPSWQFPLPGHLPAPQCSLNRPL